MANREFHTKNIKEKAAHLASMFGHGDLPQVNQGFSASSGTRAGGLTRTMDQSKRNFSIVQENFTLKAIDEFELISKRPKCIVFR